MREGAGWCVARLRLAEDLGAIEGGGCLRGRRSRRGERPGDRRAGKISSGPSARATTTSRSRSFPRRAVHDPAVARASASTGPGQVVVMFHCGSRGFGHQVAPTTCAVRRGDGRLWHHGSRPRAGVRAVGSPKAGLLRRDECRGQHRLRQPASDHAPCPRGDRAGVRRDPHALGLARRVRRLPQHRQGRAPHGRRRASSSWSCIARVRPAPSDRASPSSPRPTGDRAASHHRGLHGDGLRPARRDGACDGRDLQIHRARRRAHDVAVRGQASRGGREPHSRDGGTRHRRARRLQVRVAEEAGFAYKDLSEVVRVAHRLDVSRKVVSLRPIGNIKG